MSMRGGLSRGFTIVELLIVIVIIGILAAIVIVAYTGIQNKAYDSAVEHDLEELGKQLQMYYVQTGTWPQGLGYTVYTPPISIKITKNAYGGGFVFSGVTYNVVYCWPNAANPSTFAIVAQSKSGNVIENRNGSVGVASYTFTGGSVVICPNAGVPMDNSANRDWLYNGGWTPAVNNS